MARAQPEDGRIGDIWRVTGAEHEMVVQQVNRYTITLNSVSEPQPSGWGYDLGGWDNVLYRIREDLTEVQAGDVVHLYVPPSDVYLLGVKIDTQRPVLSAWFGFQTGREPEPDVEDAGLYFHPCADETFDCELLFRPFAMLPDGTRVRDADGRPWRFAAPFFFADEDGARGEPAWPVELPGDEAAAEALRATTPAAQTTAWTRRAGVSPSAFDHRWKL
jgi:hypothetical protein